VRDAPADAFLADAIQSAGRSGRFSVEAGTDEAEHFPAQSKCQRRYAPMVFGIIPDSAFGFVGIPIQAWFH
jgi:hypothetical protein